ncbi:hypothetical protein K440DRAFT_307893 [Wilcoxina mikolae CBS 423.85]|nr:hypothetical protein K440DRAFT_307893 [Wilcoxina mikolae CBS 423.85]
MVRMKTTWRRERGGDFVFPLFLWRYLCIHTFSPFLSNCYLIALCPALCVPNYILSSTYQVLKYSLVNITIQIPITHTQTHTMQSYMDFNTCSYDNPNCTPSSSSFSFSSSNGSPGGSYSLLA